MNRLVRVDPYFPGSWDLLVPYITSALYNGGGIVDWTPGDVFAASASGQVELWALVSGADVFGALVTCTTTFPQRKVMEILVLGTDAHAEDKWLEMLVEFKQKVKAAGFDAIIGTGRPGWAKKLHAIERRVFEVKL